MCIDLCGSVSYSSKYLRNSSVGFLFLHFLFLMLRDDQNSLYVCVHAKSLQLCPTLCNPMNYSPPGSSIHGILQARILEWVAMPSSRGSSQPRDQTHVSYISCIGRWVLYHWHCLGSPYTVVESSKYRQTSSFQQRQVLEIIKDGVRRQYDTGSPLEWIIRESSPAIVTFNWSLKD